MINEKVNNNVVNLNNESPVIMINKFLDKPSFSDNTKKSYAQSIKSFFKFIRNKELHELKYEDLKINLHELESYQKFLMDSGKNNSSINQNIHCISSLYKSLKGYGLDVNYEVFNNLQRLKENNRNSYGILDWNEVEQMIELVKWEQRGDEKSILIELGARTSFRLDALLNLKWTDFKKINGVYVISIVDKGEIHEKPIWEKDYERIKYLQDRNREYVFSIDSKTVNRMMKRLVSKMGLKDRNITFHSLKKVGINEVGYLTGGDIKAMQQQGNHKDVNTTLDHYQEIEKDPSKMACLLIGEEPDLSKLEEMSKEDLIGLINSLDRVTQFKILNKLKGKRGD